MAGRGMDSCRHSVSCWKPEPSPGGPPPFLQRGIQAGPRLNRLSLHFAVLLSARGPESGSSLCSPGPNVSPRTAGVHAARLWSPTSAHAPTLRPAAQQAQCKGVTPKCTSKASKLEPLWLRLSVRCSNMKPGSSFKISVKQPHHAVYCDFLQCLHATRSAVQRKACSWL